MFTEADHFHDRNRVLAKQAIAQPANLADGTTGVVLYWDKYPLTMTNPEAIRVATLIADTVEANRDRR
ncbi:hypothetical protein SAMN04489752_1481 [Brevibacterium siliguriense]|uniref:Uncharacterized protein n=1 Tax=Brevibacterium siliguriense TaxID=1136497 RepID=A0A1H1RC54_9MICO|nr:hypothetical protein SAMN04489752_1481 [Brevibacterium siliguriense]